jgi:diguanylate cyclase (GGDEF)-like protein
MPLIPRQDRVLVGGLLVAVVVVFARPVGYLLEVARDVERTSGLSLLPALVILAVVFAFHEQGKRQESKLRALAAETDATQAHTRAVELERMVNFGQALGRSLDLETIRDVAQHYLPTLAGTETVWVMLRLGDRWHAVTPQALDARPEADRLRLRIADWVMSGDVDSSSNTVEGHFCLRLAAGGHLVGVLGVPESAGPFNDARQRVLETAAALLAISVRNVELFRELRESGVRDALTGCFNRAHADEAIDTELRRARRTRLPVSLLMFDLDYFKDINDRYGHQCGDAVLAAVGASMRDVLRGSDLKVRYGGEEFLVVLPDTASDGAIRAAETLRRAIRDLQVPWNHETLTITASFGVAVAYAGEFDRAALIGRADAALYRAKHEGRNCVRVSETPVEDAEVARV